MEKILFITSLFVSFYFLLVTVKILVEQYYSLKRMFLSKLSIIKQKKTFYFSCLIFFIGGILLYFFNQQILGQILIILVFYVAIIDVSLKNYHFTRRNLFILSLSGIINTILGYFIFHYSSFLGVIFLLIISNFSLIISFYLLLPIEYLIKEHFINKAKRKIIDNNYIVIGVTGSFGKTTTKNFIYALLKNDFLISRQDHNYNTLMGLSKYINNEVKKEDQILLVELGVDHLNSMIKFKKLFSLDYAIVCSIGEMHLATFKSIDNIAREKLSIQELLKENGKLYIHEEIAREFQKYLKRNYVCFSENDLEYNQDFFFSIKYFDQIIKTPLLIKKQLSSLSLAIKIAESFHLPKQKIAFNISSLEIPSRRMNSFQFHNFLVIDNSYNGNLSSILEIISILEKDHRKKIVFTGGLIELGNKYLSYNEILGETLNAFDTVYLISDNQKHPLTHHLKQDKLIVVSSLKKAYEDLKNISEEAILLLLSKGSDVYLH